MTRAINVATNPRIDVEAPTEIILLGLHKALNKFPPILYQSSKNLIGLPSYKVDGCDPDRPKDAFKHEPENHLTNHI